jgi:GNAT superfamily N-acetyltransferase
MSPATRRDVTAISYRPARETDMPRTLEIFRSASDSLYGDSHQASPHKDRIVHDRSLACRASILQSDPGRFWVAENDGAVIGYGGATLRDRVWFLASLYVLPEYQGVGVGRELLRRTLDGLPDETVLATISYAINPVSNTIYAKSGMYPRTTLVFMSGPGTSPATSGLVLDPFDARSIDQDLLGTIDLAVIECRRPMDHEMWSALFDVQGFVVRRTSGAPVGYVYVQRSGHIGPAATLLERDFPDMLDLGIRAARDGGATNAKLLIPGAARLGIERLFERGFRFEPGFELFLSSRPYGLLDRYVSSGADANW